MIACPPPSCDTLARVELTSAQRDKVGVARGADAVAAALRGGASCGNSKLARDLRRSGFGAWLPLTPLTPPRGAPGARGRGRGRRRYLIQADYERVERRALTAAN
jgi:hypothetical protein